MTKQHEMTEDEIISNGLLFIRDGIIHNDWTQVCNGYGVITGEELPPPAPVKVLTKLEKIRAAVALAGTAEASEQEKAPEVPSEVEKAPEAPKKRRGRPSKGETVTVIDSSASEKAVSPATTDKTIMEVKETKVGSMTYITGGEDRQELERNILLDAKKDKLAKRPITSNITDTSQSKSDIRFYDEPKQKPSWT